MYYSRLVEKERHFVDTSIACRALGINPKDLMKDLEIFKDFKINIENTLLKVYGHKLYGHKLCKNI